MLDVSIGQTGSPTPNQGQRCYVNKLSNVENYLHIKQGLEEVFKL